MSHLNRLLGPSSVVLAFMVLVLIGFAGRTPAWWETPPVTHRESELDPAPHDKLPLEVARDRARLMHDMSIAALESMHRTYFQREKSIIPSFVMEDVFGQMKRQWKVEAHWIAVNMKAMSVDHEPKTEFEKEAARVLATGEVAIEEISKACATSGLILAVQELGSLALKLAGSEEQKMRLLPSLASGETLVFRPGAGLVARLKIAEWPKLAGK